MKLYFQCKEENGEWKPFDGGVPNFYFDDPYAASRAWFMLSLSIVNLQFRCVDEVGKVVELPCPSEETGELIYLSDNSAYIPGQLKYQ